MKNLILLLVIITFSSCRVAKKSWVEENYTEKATVKESLTVQNETFEKRFQEISETFTSKFQQISESKSSSSSESESEDTSVTGTITAEDGKEKSVTIGGTTIKSNGANISFETNSSKATSKELQTKFQELSNQLQWKNELTENLQLEVRSLKNELADFRSTYESEKNTSSKEVTKRGFSFGVWMVLLIVAVLIIVSWRLKLFGKISKLFKIPTQNT